MKYKRTGRSLDYKHIKQLQEGTPLLVVYHIENWAIPPDQPEDIETVRISRTGYVDLYDKNGARLGVRDALKNDLVDVYRIVEVIIDDKDI